MSKNTNITQELHWRALHERFFIGTRLTEVLARDEAGNILFKGDQPVVRRERQSVNELEEAIADGTLDRMLADCAAELHDGDIAVALKAWRRVLSSTQTNLKKRSQVGPTDWVRFELLWQFTTDKLAAASKDAVGGGLPQWAFGPEQIDRVNDPAVLQKIINSIADVCSTKANSPRYAEQLGSNYREVANANRAYARKRMKALNSAKGQIDPALLSKLQKGSAKLSSAETAALLKLLGIDNS